MKPYLFLLGGHDLGMTTIRALLEQRQVNFIDRNLSWGAKWTAYQDVLDHFDWKNEFLVGIELGGVKPSQALLIDHHNELAHLPASLEQVAQLLAVSLSREQQLIAAMRPTTVAIFRLCNN